MPQFHSLMPVLRVRNLPSSIDWYKRILGFECIWQSPNDGPGDNCLLRSGSIEIMLTTGDHLGSTPAFSGTFYFPMTGIDEFYQQVKDQAELVWSLEEMDYGTREFGIRDLDGYMLAFSENVK